MGMRFGHMMYGGSWFMILFWIVIIIGVIYLLSKGNINLDSSHDKSSRRSGRDEKSPEEIAKERYARGEIDKEKFDEIMKDLRN